MSFIEAAAEKSVKRKRVSKAIESLLGLQILDGAINHLNAISREFSKEVDNIDYATEIEKLNDKISWYTDELSETNEGISEQEELKAEATKELVRIRSEIENALKAGDKTKLLKDIKDTENLVRLSEEQEKDAVKSLSLIISSEETSKLLLKNKAIAAQSLLRSLSESKKFPKVNIPILEELLDGNTCFCGSDLSDSTTEGQSRRENIRHTIDESRESDRRQEVASSLFYKVRSDSFNEPYHNWLNKYKIASRSLQSASSSLYSNNNRLADLKTAVDKIQDTNIRELRELEDQYRAKSDKAISKISEMSHKAKNAEVEISKAEEVRTKYEKKYGRTNTSTKKVLLSREIEAVFKSIVNSLKEKELLRVSSEMNRIFLEMIGSSPEENDLTLITKAELTNNFDIVVYGPQGHMLNPDQDLNGASRRAITLAFILALTKVSEVEAPNVIDTPLGMMSGYVKQSVLTQTLREGCQVILFLTHDEIKGVEKIIDNFAGSVYTLTNPSHYPKMLAHPPKTDDSRILRCECNHRQTCPICERTDIVEDYYA